MYTPNDEERKLMQARLDNNNRAFVKLADIDLTRLEDGGYITITGNQIEDFDLTQKGLKFLAEN